TYLRCLPSSVDDRGKSVIVSMLALTEQIPLTYNPDEHIHRV
ncbi:unnamed protein product, partial [Rotaria sp. Silwood2]